MHKLPCRSLGSLLIALSGLLSLASCTAEQREYASTGAGGDATTSASTSASASSTASTSGAGGAGGSGGSMGMGGGPCGASPEMVVDQSQLQSAGNLVVSPMQSPGQTFILQSAGRIAGIEVALTMCQATPMDTITLELFAGAGVDRTSLAIVDRLGAGLPGPGACGVVPEALKPDTTGPGYFDLLPFCVDAVPGSLYSFELRTKAVSSGKCVGNLCDGTPMPCTSDADCLNPADFRVGDGSDAYGGGFEVVNGKDYPSNDLAFKILVAK
jgi:hypothetical protein